MTSYWISFRIHDNPTYAARLKALTDEIDNISTTNWKETTSFHLIETAHDIATVAAKLKAKIDTKVDKIVLRRIDNQAARYIGNIGNTADLLALMPYITRA